MTILQVLQQAKAQLFSITDDPAFEAEILLAFVLEKPRSFLHAWPQTSLSMQQAKQFAALTERRSNKEPVAYLIGKREFWSHELSVTADTLIPRPETELLVETALILLSSRTERVNVLELGTGSGAIAIALASEQPSWQIVATDINPAALAVARQNAERFALKNIKFLCGSWFAALAKEAGTEDFDMVISNPPYIALSEWPDYQAGLAFEPYSALVSGKDGLDAIREISHLAKDYLRQGAYLLLEHGFWQGEAVRQLFAKEGYQEIRTLKDMTNKERVTLGRFIK
jgi:release factor glutamine methyltransferase